MKISQIGQFVKTNPNKPKQTQFRRQKMPPRFISPLKIRIFHKNMNIGKLLRVYYVRIVCRYEAILMGISIWIDTGLALLLGLKIKGTDNV
jgi:hypothetical protein